ncbi:TetR/AcrR family transcriptional regulator [Psychrobacter sp. I-STPA6b]|uniref:TetR/AcrR family transcriptional regulator n=1 Tax=Psychrobacter sp. I-STPA6b TaxID=2585718 RepID=UPI001D0C4AC9|nr:TetR/AcrR family transcriptional regulator [Psychrobacter sp. I-STPA6b]
MTESRDNTIKDMLVDSELARQLVPNKFKFTSQQGRIRRQKLVMGAKKLSETKPVKDITLAEVCVEAGIPRASAYHFFPNVEAIFLALRFLNAIEIMETLEKVDINNFDRWQGYVKALIEAMVGVLKEDPTKAQLIYGANTPDFEGDKFGERMDNQVVKLAYQRLSSQYEMPSYEDLEKVMLVTFSIIHGIFGLSFRHYEQVTDEYAQEAMIASIAYLRCYLPEKLPRRSH